MKLKTGTLLQGGKYKVVKVLGQGSFGITYLAEHTVLGKNVCIKEFFMKELNSRDDDGSITGLTDGTLSYKYAQKFRKEAQSLARLEHPNIVKVTDCFDENGTCYYTMDYIEGENLNDYLKHCIISPETAVDIIKQVAEALIYMHEEKQMLHLDLKPGNIMRRTSDGHIFLIDFGLAKQFDQNGAPETSTTIGLGTAGYAPIEQANQAKHGDFRPTIDVYALGATLYKLLTRETPPAASELVSDDELIAENLKKHNVSDALASAVINAMMPSVKKRTLTVRAFVESLATSLGNSEQNADEKPIFAEEPIDADDEKTEIVGENKENESVNIEELRKEAQTIAQQYKDGYNHYVNAEILPCFIYNLRAEDYQKIIDMKDEIARQQKIEDEILSIAAEVEAERPGLFAHPFSFNGRIGRLEYWISYILSYVCSYVTGFIAGASNIPAFLILLIPIYWFLWAQGAKRCHDRDNSGWYQIIPFYFLVMLFGGGNDFKNNYGPEPK